MGEALLIAVLATPALAGMVLPFCRVRLARVVAAVASLVTLAASCGLLVGRHDARAAVDPWHEVDLPWASALRLRFHIGVDGISWPLIVLTALLIACCVAYLLFGAPAEAADERRLPLLLSALFVLATAMLGAFLALDVILLFVFFELTLAPMYVVIAGWGGPERKAAALKFLLYTGLGSLLLAIGMLLLVAKAGTADIATLSAAHGGGLSHASQYVIFVFLLLAFAIKAPLWPLHTWLPDAHTQAPTVGSVLLAGVLLKLGSYGLIRVVLPVLPAASAGLAWLLGALAVTAIVVGSLVCLAQTELKRLIAYSSVGHMGFVLLGIATAAAGSEIGLQAALLGNLAHGVITALLFFTVGGLKDRRGSVELADLPGAVRRAPLLCAVLCFAAVASFGLPGLAGFWGELFGILAAWRHGDIWWQAYAVVAAVATAVVVAYFLRALFRLNAPSTLPDDVTADGGVGLRGLRVGEVIAMVPLVLAIVGLGVWPGGVLSMAADAVRFVTGSLG